MPLWKSLAARQSKPDHGRNTKVGDAASKPLRLLSAGVAIRNPAKVTWQYEIFRRLAPAAEAAKTGVFSGTRRKSGPTPKIAADLKIIESANLATRVAAPLRKSS
jgi:hypothetical protein